MSAGELKDGETCMLTNSVTCMARSSCLTDGQKHTDIVLFFIRPYYPNNILSDCSSFIYSVNNFFNTPILKY